MPSKQDTKTNEKAAAKPVKVKVPTVYAYAFYGGIIKSGISVVKVTHDHPELDYDKFKLFYGDGLKGRWVKCARPIETVQALVNEKLTQYKITDMLYRLDTVEISKILKEATDASKCSTIGVYNTKKEDGDESDDDKNEKKETKKAKDESDDDEEETKPKKETKAKKETKKAKEESDDEEETKPKKETKAKKETKETKESKKAKDDSDDEETKPKKDTKVKKETKESKSKKTVKDSDDDVPKSKSNVKQIVLSSDDEEEEED